MGKPGIELVLDGEHRAPVRFLHFVTNTVRTHRVFLHEARREALADRGPLSSLYRPLQGHLVAMLDHSVEVWDLETREVIGTQAIDEK